MTAPTIDIDCIILGGGCAGLWLLNELHSRGYSAVLFERDALGAGQSSAAQGIIHGGVKYGGGAAAAALAAMPAAWRDCLAGRGRLDLRGCRVLSDHTWLWSGGGGAAGLATALAGRLLRSAARRLSPDDYPGALRAPGLRGPVYRLDEPVLDTSSLLACLAGPQRQHIYRIDWRRARLRVADGAAQLQLPECTLAPGCLLLAAGAGNESLITALGAREPAMQRRPLQQVVVRHEYPGELFGHCLDGAGAPRLTVTTHRGTDGAYIWYLGGGLASDAAELAPADLIARARQELATQLPWLDLGHSEWRTLRVDRAEPRTPGKRLPGGPFLAGIAGVANALALWPVKLALCPLLGECLLHLLDARGLHPRFQPDLSPLHALGTPSLATPCWETLFQ